MGFTTEGVLNKKIIIRKIFIWENKSVNDLYLLLLSQGREEGGGKKGAEDLRLEEVCEEG